MNPFVLKLLFGICAGSVIYNYIGYPLLLFLLSILLQAKSDLLFLMRGPKNRRCAPQVNELPSVAMLLSVYNEEDVIKAKIQNALLSDYPAEKLELLIGLDAPTDFTAERAKEAQSERCRIFAFPVRRGKLAVIRDLAQRTSAPILVLTDANTMFERGCIRRLMRHFADPDVGVVSGRHIWVTNAGTEPSTEALYWRYESAVKFLESRLNCLLGAYGSVYAVRRSLFHSTRDSLIEDFQIPLEILFGGHRIVYDSEAIAIEDLAPTFATNFERRVRVAAGGYQTLMNNPQCLNPLKGLPAFAYFSHRVLRWLAPFFLLTAFFCNTWLVREPLFVLLLALQAAVYSMAAVAYWGQKRGKSTAFSSIPLGFCSMNVALLLGFYRYICGSQSKTWRVAPRTISTNTPYTAIERDH